MDKEEIDADAEAQVVPTVTSSVIGAFFDALAREEDVGDVAEGFRKLVLEDGVFAEPAIKAIMFPDEP